MWKLWLEKWPEIPAVAIILLSQSVSRARERGCPFSHRNRGPGPWPLITRYVSNVWTAHKGYLPRPIWMEQPLRKGSVYEALMMTQMHEGFEVESTEMSCTPKWTEGRKPASEGTVNSADWRNPKYPRVHAAQNMQWSSSCKSKDFQMTSMRSSVIGKRLDEGVPWERLMPWRTRCRRRQFWRGSAKPCSICRALTPERYTLIEACCRERARKVANKPSVHSSAGQGDPDEWILPNWWQKEINWDWGVA